MKTIIILMSIFIFTFVSVAHALDLSSSTDQLRKVEKDVALMWKKNIEEKDTSGKKRSKTTSTGTDTKDSDTTRTTGQQSRTGAADITAPLEILFIDHLMELEQTQAPFKRCQLITSPKLGRDFGLSAELRPGVIDTIKADYLTKAAQSNSFIRDLADETEIRSYRDCMATYGSVIGSAYLILTQDLDDLKISVKKDNAGTISVTGLGYDDVLSLARSALDRVIAGDKKSPSIARIRERITSELSPCRFDRSLENIQCGSSLLIIGTKPQLIAQGIKWYGDGSYAGYAGTYKLSRSWSLSDALEQLKSTERYSKFAAEVARYTEDLETRGKTKEATWAKKKALSMSAAGKQELGAGKLLPSPH